MDVGQFKILLEKINSLHKSMSLDGNISKIEQELMKSYVSQLYEACVSDKESAKVSLPAVKQETPVEPVKTYTPPVETKVLETPVYKETPAVQQTPAAKNTPVVQNTPPVVHNTPVVQDPVVNVPPVVHKEPVIQTSNETHAQGSNGPKTLNERLAENQNKTVTTNDKFKPDEEPKAAYKPPIIINVDHLKETGNSTPPPPPPPPPPKAEPIPVQSQTPAYSAPSPSATNTGGISINSISDYFNLHNKKSISEISDRLSSAPIGDLTKAIGLNDKISMIRELWADDQFAFNNSLNHLNSLGSFAEARDYVLSTCVPNYKWDEAKKLSRAKQFIDLLRRRYPS